MKKNFSQLVLVISLACFVANCFLMVELQKIWAGGQILFCDFYGQWTLCAYTLQSVDPYTITGLKTPLIEEIGIIPAILSTVPWGLVLGNFFYPGFFKIGIAGTYFILLNVFFLWKATALLKQRFDLSVAVLPAFFASFFISIHFGNAGAVICCLLIFSCIFADESPILSGVLLSLAMVKPQVALPICFALLLRKNFKVLTVAAVIDFAAWGIAALMTNQSPITLLTEFLSIKTGGGTAFAGLFTLAFPEGSSLAMPTSMLAGCLFIWLAWKLGFKDDKYFWACPAYLATTFFAYSFHNEFFILIVPALACLYLASRTESLAMKIFLLAAFVFMATGFYWLLLLLKDSFADVVISFWLARTVFAVVLILLGFFMARRFKNSA